MLSSSSTGGSPAAARLVDLVTLPKLMQHARMLQAIADANYGNRYIHLPGFNATVSYIESTLRGSTNFNISKQYFTRPGFTVIGDPALTVMTGNDSLTYAYDIDYNVFLWSGALNGSAVPLVYVSNSGCRSARTYTICPHTTYLRLLLV